MWLLHVVLQAVVRSSHQCAVALIWPALCDFTLEIHFRFNVIEMTELELLDQKSWEEFLNAPIAVLMLSKSDCLACADWTEELNIWFGSDTVPENVRFGTLLLDTPGIGRFKIAQPWVSEVDLLPFNAIFINGERVKEWASGNLSLLQNRLEKLL
jgi:hypothetical protein